MNSAIRITPCDTFYFKTAEPMEMGEQHTATGLFPPPVQTIVGALRTALLRQRKILFTDYHLGKIPDDLMEEVGPSDQPAPFTVTGPVFEFRGEIFVPAPWHWFRDKSTKNTSQPIAVLKSRPITSSLLACSTPQNLLWVQGGSDLASLGGSWISFSALKNHAETLTISTTFTELSDSLAGQEILLEPDFLFGIEYRTGIALGGKDGDDNDQTARRLRRRVRKSHLYTFPHIRVCSGVALLVGIDGLPSLADHGTLFLGAEQRFGWYEKIDAPDFAVRPLENLNLALNPVHVTVKTKELVRATGKTLFIGGWDLKKHFHKPMQAYYPAGTLFNENINNQCIAL